MKCLKCRQLLVEFSEGRLESELSQEIREHISDCGACRRELEDFQSSLILIEDTRKLERAPGPPGDFVEQVMNRVQQNNSSRPSFRRLALGITVACCLLGIGMVLFFQGGFMEKEYPVSASDGAAITRGENSDSIFSINHMKRELVRMLDQTLEVIAEGEQEWEIEI